MHQSTMTQSDIAKLTSFSHGVPPDKLQFCSISQVDDRELSVAKHYCKKSRCFNNALQKALVDDCDVIIGYVYMGDLGIVIEHAWNWKSEQHIDLTAQLFWQHNFDDNHFMALVHLTHEEAMIRFDKGLHVDHLALRKDKQYSHLFRHKRNISENLKAD